VGGGGSERLPGLIKQMSVRGSEQAVVTDFDEAFGAARNRGVRDYDVWLKLLDDADVSLGRTEY
jgi:hypothetical protein